MKASKKKRPQRILFKLYNAIDRLKCGLRMWPEKITIVSGADSSHFKSLMQFIESVSRYEPNSYLVIFDLGLTDEESVLLKETFPNIDYRVFDFSKYPAYFDIRIEAGQYAWKPAIVSDICEEFKGLVVWLDAGCLLTQPLYQVRKTLKKFGFYSPVASFSFSVLQWTHPKTIEYLRCDEKYLTEPQLAGSVVAVDCNNARAIELIQRWKQCALIKECIAPEGSSRENHRQDQAILSILIYQSGLAKVIPQRFLGFKLHQDID